MGLQRLLKQGSFYLEPTRSVLNHVRNHAAYFAMFALAHALQPTGSAIILLTHAPFNTHYLFSIPLISSIPSTFIVYNTGTSFAITGRSQFI